MKFNKLCDLLLIESFSPYEIDLDRAYEIFRDEYVKATGQSWTKDKFLQRASNWKFYGDENGFVAVRPQYSGFVKLVGMAGSNRSKIKGFQELSKEGLPIWGAVTPYLAKKLSSSGYIQAPYLLLKFLLSTVGKQFLGDVDVTLNKDGSITMVYDDVGEVTKVFVGSKEYYERLLNDPRMDKIPGFIKKGILSLIAK